jgi:hypothetical protein
MYITSNPPTSRPTSWAKTNPITESGEIPVNEFVKDLARVNAGLAKEVEGVKNMAAPIQIGTQT